MPSIRRTSILILRGMVSVEGLKRFVTSRVCQSKESKSVAPRVWKEFSLNVVLGHSTLDGFEFRETRHYSKIRPEKLLRLSLLLVLGARLCGLKRYEVMMTQK